MLANHTINGVGDLSRINGVGDLSRINGVGDLSRIWIYCLGPLVLLFPKL